jgi:hypothetical protein
MLAQLGTGEAGASSDAAEGRERAITAEIELERVREAYPEVPQLSDERIASLRAALLALIDNSPRELAPTQPPRWRRGRPRPIYWLLGAAAALAAAVVIFNLNQTGPRLAGAAEARAILRGVEAALALPPEAVLHYDDSDVSAETTWPPSNGAFVT